MSHKDARTDFLIVYGAGIIRLQKWGVVGARRHGGTASQLSKLRVNVGEFAISQYGARELCRWSDALNTSLTTYESI